MLLRHAPRRILYGKQVPAGFVQINRGHPLAADLSMALLPGMFYGRNLVRNTADLTIGDANGVGAPVIATTQDGPGYKQPTNDKDGLRLTFGNGVAQLEKFTRGNTLYWRGVIVSAPGGASFTYLVGISYAANNTNPYQIYAINVGHASQVQTAWNSGGASSGGTGYTGLTFGASCFHSIAATFKAGGNAILYVDGKQVESNAFGASVPNTSGSEIFMVGTLPSGAGPNTLQCTHNLVLGWNRALSAAEIQMLDAAPYAIFAPADTIMPALFNPLSFVSLLGTARAASAGRAAGGFSLPLTSRGSQELQGRAAPSGTAALSVRAATAAKGISSASTATALEARLTQALRARGGGSAAAALGGKVTAMLASAAGMRSTATLLAAGKAALRGAATATGVAQLVARGTTSAAGRVALSVGVLLNARVAIMITAAGRLSILVVIPARIVRSVGRRLRIVYNALLRPSDDAS
ncbi:MAG TPA: LamG-like jellyroll fold domain-containing protein [Dehalococcoidia bacterium]